MLHLVSVSKAYGPRTLFDGVSWHVPPGQRVGFVGRNGVGKTTIFRIIAGLESPDDGEVVLKKGIRLGYLTQEPEDLGQATPLAAVLAAGGEARALAEELARLEAELHGSSDANRTRSWPTPRFSISVISQRGPNPIAQVVSV